MTQALRQEIARSAVGAQLSTVRALMTRYQASPVTVRKAMARLADEGLLDARPGHGTFVRAGGPSPPVARDFSWQALALGPARVSADALGGLLAAPVPGAINLAGGYPADELQAVRLVSQAMARAARRLTVWGRMPIEGLGELRAWFAESVGPGVSPHEVLVCPGSQSAIATVFAALTVPGAPVLVESPTYLGAIVAARAAGLQLVPVPTDTDGVRVDMLAQAFATTGARLFYSQPTYANPTGVSLAVGRRAQLLEVVGHAKAVIVEDDWCRDLSFARTPPRPLMLDDRHGHVVHLRSLTKSCAPSLRIGAIVARGAVLARLIAARGLADFFVSGPLQETAVEVVRSPAWARHLRGLRAALLRRRDVLVAAVSRHLGSDALTHVPDGGMHLWVRLPDRVDDLTVVRRAAERNVLVCPGRQCFPAEPTGSYLRLSYASAPETAAAKAVEILARVVQGPRRPR